MGIINDASKSWSGMSTGGKWGSGAAAVGLGLLWARDNKKKQKQYERELKAYNDRLNAANDYGESLGGEYYPVEAAHAAREANIESAFSSIGEMFEGRDGLYDQMADDSFALGKDYLKDERSSAARELKFSLARSGLSAGSVDVDKHAELNTRYLDGLSMARAEADSAASGFRNQDMALRNNLMGLAAGGNVTGSQISAMGTPAPASAITPSNLGQTFVGLTDFIGSARNPFAAGLGGGGAAPTGRPSNINNRYSGTVNR